ncbi:MAG: nickel-dependent hydrogenase large subunit [Candidatus Thiodiazotropha sp. (ex Dulcina madagascariensis)]|nr:nickel-dependent hydrogenase large subunit [Candidatus Thiodiazotropha sp. (ex Dulcina madagascariensis)]
MTETFYDVMRRQGITHRSFLKFCSLTASALGLGPAMVPRIAEEIQEFVPHSWYNYPDGVKGLHPWDGVTEPSFQLGPNAKGSKTNIEQIDEDAKYSWIKAPRWRGHAMEVGPLARYIVGYASGHEEITEQINFVLKTLSACVIWMASTLQTSRMILRS